MIVRLATLLTPVHKKDLREKVSNYRPISLLSIISKVMERCIHNRVYPILSALISKTQHGFLKKRSCVTQLLSVLHDIGKNLDNNKQVDMIYLDFSKAFDSVDYAILYRKLYAHGLRGSILLWFKDYLTDRWQRVVLENVASEYNMSILGIIRNDRLKYLKNGKQTEAREGNVDKGGYGNNQFVDHLTVPLAHMSTNSVSFWLSKFICEVVTRLNSVSVRKVVYVRL